MFALLEIARIYKALNCTYTYDKSKGGDTRKLQRRMVPPKKLGRVTLSRKKEPAFVVSFIRSTECAPEELWGQGLFGRCPKALE